MDKIRTYNKKLSLRETVFLTNKIIQIFNGQI